jgi:hypothetical protein
MERSNKSKSFMREHELIGIANIEDDDDVGYDFNKVYAKIDTTLDLDYYFQQRADSNKLLFNKKTLLKITHEKLMNRNVVINAINLQDFPFRKIRQIIKDLTKELKEAKIKGVLEFHANDTTQSSYHFHFWTWKHYEERARGFLSSYMIDNNYASASNVKIEGVFEKRIDEDTSKADKKVLKEENLQSKYNATDEDEDFDAKKEKRKRINDLKKKYERANILEDNAKKENDKMFSDLTLKTIKMINNIKEKTKNLKEENQISSSNISTTHVSKETSLDEINKHIEEIRIKINSHKK